jgi:phage terminase small subunit
VTETQETVQLTARQKKAIPVLVTSCTYSQGAQETGISRKTLYEWLKQPQFRAELDRQRDEVVADAFGILTQSLIKAVENLVSLLDNKDDRLKRLAANDIIEYFLKHKETEDLEERVTAIEARLAGLKPS